MGHLTVYPANLVMTGRGANAAVSFTEYRNFGNRNESTRRMVSQAISLDEYHLPNGFQIGLWTDDYPKLFTRRYNANLHASLRTGGEKRMRLFVPDFMFDCWPDAGIEDYDKLAGKIALAGQLPPQRPEVFWIGSYKTHRNRKRLFDLKLDPNAFDLYSELQPHPETFVSLVDHTRYKYLLDVEGRGYSGRLKLLLFSRRPVFMVERPFVEYYAIGLKPFVHYIPVKRDLSDLSAKHEWAEAHSAECNEIAANALEFAKENLTRKRALEIFRHTLHSVQRMAWAG